MVSLRNPSNGVIKRFLRPGTREVGTSHPVLQSLTDNEKLLASPLTTLQDAEKPAVHLPKMNFTPWALLVFAAVAVASTGAAMCDIVALSRLLVNGNVTTCSRKTGYNLASLPAPTDAQISALCGSDTCMAAVTTVTQIAPHECTIGSLRLYADVIDPLKQRCGCASGSMSTVGSGSSSSVGAIVIITSGSGSDSAADVGMSGSAGTASGSAAVSPAKTEPPKTSTPRPQPTTSTPKPTSGTGNAGVGAPALSTLTAALVLATAVGVIL
ncbi:hypothetical protein BBJ28_00013096 [Nothophytophthora sp. Chile5]|nr:hypothetical protein BBJ28_00013096 [Nothophytophthora sp. Chile5]